MLDTFALNWYLSMYVLAALTVSVSLLKPEYIAVSGSFTLPQSYGVEFSEFLFESRQSGQIVQSSILNVGSAYLLSFLLKNPFGSIQGVAPPIPPLPKASTTTSVSTVFISNINSPLTSPSLLHL